MSNTKDTELHNKALRTMRDAVLLRHTPVGTIKKIQE